MSHPYRRLFVRRELYALMGPAYRRLYRLALLVTAMLLALGFALGGLRTLRERMDDPFTHTLEVPVPFSGVAEADRWKETFLEPASRDSFLIEAAEFSQVSFEWIRHAETGLSVPLRTRSLAPQSPLTRRILSETGDILLRRGKLDLEGHPDAPCGLVVTREVLERLGYDPGTMQYIPYQLSDLGDFTLLLPVTAVVRRLPDNCDMAMSDNMAILRNEPYATGLVAPFDSDGRLSFLVPGKDTAGLENRLRQAPFAADIIRIKTEALALDQRHPYVRLDLFMSDNLDMAARQVWRDRLQQYLDPDDRVLLTFPVYCRELTAESPFALRKHRINFFFSRLDRVREFEQSLYQLSGLSVDLSRIESSRNFALVARLTSALSIALFLFCLLGMVFFMEHLVRSHLHEHRQGLGTLAAFGLSETEMRRMYMQVLLRYTLYATGLAMAATLLVKGLLHAVGQGHLLLLASPFIPAALVLCGLVVLVSTRKSIHFYLRRTPGDLIFNR